MTVVFVVFALFVPDSMTTSEDDRLLTVCLAGHSEVVSHNHVELKIYLDGESVTIPTDVGIDDADCSKGMRAIHTHDDSGRLHIETPFESTPKLGHFFTIWGQPFDSNHLMDRTVDASHEIVMRVSSSQEAFESGEYVVSDEYGDHVLNDGEVIVIEYRSK